MIAIREPYYDAIIPVRDREGVFVKSITAAAEAAAEPPPWPFGLHAALDYADLRFSGAPKSLDLRSRHDRFESLIIQK